MVRSAMTSSVTRQASPATPRSRSLVRRPTSGQVARQQRRHSRQPAAPDGSPPCLYSATSFTVDVDVTNGQSYNIELYLLDYDNAR